jgi:UDPglucose 6-dehydrogenase
MKIIVAGYGFVGKAVVNTLKHTHNCIIVDPKYTPNTVSQHLDADGVIVCVNTPTLSNGMCDVSNVREVLDGIPTNIPVLIKSTILPNELQKIIEDYQSHAICYSPELLRAKSSDFDFENQTFMILGGNDDNGFWQDLFSPLLSKCKIFFRCSVVEAAMVKYTINSFLATKVAFFNQIYDLCNSNGSDYEIVRQILTHDNRIGSSHTLVPGVDGERGFGGHCFPKDTKTFLNYAADLNNPLSILETASLYNKTVRKDLDL